jgi:membrane-bound serine protease (ClpP class)
MKVRLIVAILSTLLEEIILAAIILFGLPKLGIQLPPWVLIVLMSALVAFAVFTYRKGSRALKRAPVGGLTAMLGSEGMVVSPLAPEGLVRIKGELWTAKSASGEIGANVVVTVVGQEGLKLVVRQSSDLKESR